MKMTFFHSITSRSASSARRSRSLDCDAYERMRASIFASRSPYSGPLSSSSRQPAMHDEIGIAADRRREVAVVLEREREVAEVAPRSRRRASSSGGRCS